MAVKEIKDIDISVLTKLKKQESIIRLVYSFLRRKSFFVMQHLKS
ncbi:Uncharacterised protein [Catenibacterium mitsuokai]|nr:Uncharacterised protein [Catenibacterium mitsuokai]